MCRKIPYGFEKKETLRPREDEAEKVRYFFKTYLAGAPLKDAGAGIPLSPPALRDMMRNDLYAEIVGEETLALAREEIARRTTRVKGWSGRKERIVIPTRFRLAEGEGEEMYRRVSPLW